MRGVLVYQSHTHPSRPDKGVHAHPPRSLQRARVGDPEQVCGWWVLRFSVQRWVGTCEEEIRFRPLCGCQAATPTGAHNQSKPCEAMAGGPLVSGVGPHGRLERQL